MPDLTIKSEKTNECGIILKEWKFKCLECGTHSRFQASNIIFKEIKYFCSCCGTSNVIKNPAFYDKK